MNCLVKVIDNFFSKPIFTNAQKIEPENIEQYPTRISLRRKLKTLEENIIALKILHILHTLEEIMKKLNFESNSSSRMN